MNKNYNRGRALEYLMKDKLEKKGYFVIRSAGSHSIDLVAFKDIPCDRNPVQSILFISCKLNEYAPPAERNGMEQVASECHATPMLTVKDSQGKWGLKEIEEQANEKVKAP